MPKKQKSRKKKSAPEKVSKSNFTGADIVNILLIALLVVLFFIPAFTMGKVFFAGDVMNVYNPYQAINADQLAHGKIPLWTDKFFCGFPLFAESQGALFYPPTRLAYAFASVGHAFTVDVFIHFFIAGFFMYILARYLGQRPLPAALAAVAFAFSGLFCSLIINFTIFRSAAWIPFIFYCVRRVLTGPGMKWTVLLSVGVLLQMMGGSLQVTAITILLVALDAIYVILSSLANKAFLMSFVRVIKVIIGIGFAAGLYAFQLLPTLELTKIAHRGVEASHDMAASFAFPVAHLADIIAPQLLGNPAKATMFPGAPQAPNYFGYIGVIGFILAIYALTSRKAGILWPIAIIFAVLSLGPAGGLFDILYTYIPTFDLFRAPDRFLIAFVFCTSLLAGFGAQKLLDRDEDGEDDEEYVEPGSRRLHIGWLISLVVLAVIAAMPWLGEPGKVIFDSILKFTVGNIAGVNISAENYAQYEAWRNYIPRVLLYMFLFTAMVPLCNLFFGRIAGGKGLVLLFLILNAVDLFAMAGENHNCRLIGGDFFAEAPASVSYIKEHSPMSRKYSFAMTNYTKSIFGNAPVTVWYQGGGGSDEDYYKLREIAAPDLGSYFGLYDAGGFASLYTEDYYLFEGVVISQLKDIASGMNIPDRLNNGRPLHLLVDTMSADYIISGVPLPEGPRFQKVYDRDVMIYRNKLSMPRAFVSHPANVAVVDTSRPEQLMKFVSSLGGFDFEGSIILPSSSGIPISPPAEAGISRDITPTTYEPGDISCEVKINRPGVFVLSDSYYPGWKAYVDGEEKPVLRANLYYRGVVLDTAGRHTVEFKYKPESFQKGLMISGLSLVLYILVIIGKNVTNKWRPAPAGAKKRTGRGSSAEDDDDDEG